MEIGSDQAVAQQLSSHVAQQGKTPQAEVSPSLKEAFDKVKEAVRVPEKSHPSLREVAESKGLPAYLINSVKELNSEWIKDVNNIGITSGASTPDTLVQEVISFINPDEVVHMGGEEENIKFVMPRDL